MRRIVASILALLCWPACSSRERPLPPSAELAYPPLAGVEASEPLEPDATIVTVLDADEVRIEGTLATLEELAQRAADDPRRPVALDLPADLPIADLGPALAALVGARAGNIGIVVDAGGEPARRTLPLPHETSVIRFQDGAGVRTVPGRVTVFLVEPISAREVRLLRTFETEGSISPPPPTLAGNPAATVTVDELASRFEDRQSSIVVLEPRPEQTVKLLCASLSSLEKGLGRRVVLSIPAPRIE